MKRRSSRKTPLWRGPEIVYSFFFFCLGDSPDFFCGRTLFSFDIQAKFIISLVFWGRREGLV